jgi:hypothetical protein
VYLSVLGWPELLPFLFDCFQSVRDAATRLLAVQIIGKLSDTCFEALDPFMASIHQLYTQVRPLACLAVSAATC